MSVLSELDSIVLRKVSNPPLTTKNSELTFTEWDEQSIKVYDVIQSIVSGENVTAYDASTVYDMFDTDITKKFASYNSRIWKAIYVGSPSTFSGQTPEEGVYWTQVTLAELIPNIIELARFSDGLKSDTIPAQIYSKSITIPSADVLQLNSTPKTIVSGTSGKIIVLVSAIFRATYNSATYATNLGLLLRHSGSSTPISGNSNKLGFTSNTINQFTLRDVTNSDQFIDGADLEVSVDSGDPTTGDSDITIDVKYYELDV